MNQRQRRPFKGRDNRENKPYRTGPTEHNNWNRKQSPGNRWNRNDKKFEGRNADQQHGGFDRKNRNDPPWKSKQNRHDRTGDRFDRNTRGKQRGDFAERKGRHGEFNRNDSTWKSKQHGNPRPNSGFDRETERKRGGDFHKRREQPQPDRTWDSRPFKEKRQKKWSNDENRPRRERRVESRPATAEPPVIVGRKSVLEALRAGTQIERILILHGTQGGIIEGIESQARQKSIRVQEVDSEKFAEVAGDENAQGVAAIIAKRKQASIEDILDRSKQRSEPALILMLDEIEDPHNLGALIRTAECSGFHGVIIPRHHSAPITSTVVKSSAGATEHLPIAEVTNLVPVIEELKKNGFWVIGLDMAGDKLYTQSDFSNPTVLVVGGEGRGIRRLVKEHCDVLVKIPLHGMIDSLNASVAGAIVMFQGRNDRVQKGKLE